MFKIVSHFIIYIFPEIMKHDEEKLDHPSDFIHANRINLHYSLVNNVSNMTNDQTILIKNNIL